MEEQYSPQSYFVKITKTDNGYLMENGEMQLLVYEDREEDEYSQHLALVSCLWDVINYFGLSGSKHDKKRIICGLEVNQC